MEHEERLKAALADRYRIEREIGSGGMATVYLARDLKHERPVAVKVLKAAHAEAIDAQRFLREIRTTANLSHPHILPLHDSGEADGFLFFVMPLVKGESLQARLAREGQLPVEEAVEIAREVADALAFAHAEGVIHRDVKPANIMLEAGHALLTDFGIARARAESEEHRLTGTRMSVGTPLYMSPEQATGEGEVDGRSDQYSLALVLYEMLAGHPPFTGPTAEAVLRQQLMTEPLSLSQLRPALPRAVATTVHRALAKSPADRFRTTAEFRAALGGAALPFLTRISRTGARVAIMATTLFLVAVVVVTVALFRSTPSEAGREPGSGTVAVAPFLNETGDSGLDWAGSYLAAMVKERLEQAGVAEVLPPDRVEAALNAAGPAADPLMVLSRDLDAGTAVTGRIFPLGASADSIRIYVDCTSLVEGNAPYPVESVVGAKNALEEAVEVVRERVSAVLAQHLDEGYGERALLPPPTNVEAYREYRRAYEVLSQGGSYEDGGFHLLQAWQLDSTFFTAALDAMANLDYIGRPRERDSIRMVLEASRDRMTPLSRQFLDYFGYAIDGEMDLALQAVRRIAERHPMEMAYSLGLEAYRLNHLEEAAEALQRWRKRDGGFLDGFVTPNYLGMYSEVLHLLGRYEEELEVALEGERRFPSEALHDVDFVQERLAALVGLGRVQEVDSLAEHFRETEQLEHLWPVTDKLMAHGHPELALAMLERELTRLEADPADDLSRRSRAHVLHRLGRHLEAHALWQEVAQEFPDSLEALGALGVTAAVLGDSALAREVDERLAAWPDILRRGYHTSWRARIATALGEKGRAVAFLRDVPVENRPVFLEAHRDFDLRGLQDFPAFEDFMRPKT